MAKPSTELPSRVFGTVSSVKTLDGRLGLWGHGWERTAIERTLWAIEVSVRGQGVSIGVHRVCNWSHEVALAAM
jgi:hypothetical protein